MPPLVSPKVMNQPVLERQLISTYWQNPDKARKFTRFMGLLQDRPPKTESGGKIYGSVEEACKHNTVTTNGDNATILPLSHSM